VPVPQAGVALAARRARYPSRPMRIRTHSRALFAAGALALAIAGCGSSKAPGVIAAPSAGLTKETTTAAPSTTPTATTPATTSTPAVPPQLAKKPVVVVPKGAAPGHLVTNDLITGSGAAASTGKTITVNYVGVLYKTGKQFDASWVRNQPFTTPLSSGSIIPGWVQGISGMKVGGRRELIVPPALAYGKAGQPPTIPGNSTLVFVVDLLSVS
jgi:peptidylprolyl isomerase